jgi:hypothetical protein
MNVIKIIVMEIVAAYAIEPQLRSIYHVLHNICVDLVQGKKRDSSHRWNAIQHLSPACRAAHDPKMYDLLSSRILRQVSDLDAEMCKVSSKRSLHVMVLLFVVMPVILGLLNQEVGSMLFDAILPSSLYVFIMSNFYLLYQSQAGFISCYVLLIAFLIWYYRHARPAYKRIKEAHHSRHDARHQTIIELRPPLLTANKLTTPRLLLAAVLSIWRYITQTIPERWLETALKFGKAKEKAQQQWQMKNLPSRFYQATTRSKNEAVGGETDESTSVVHKKKRMIIRAANRDPMKNIPDYIIALLASTNQWRRKKKRKRIQQTIMLPRSHLGRADDDLEVGSGELTNVHTQHQEEEVEDNEDETNDFDDEFNHYQVCSYFNRANDDDNDDLDDSSSPATTESPFARRKRYFFRHKTCCDYRTALAQSLLLYVADPSLQRAVKDQESFDLSSLLPLFPYSMNLQQSSQVVDNFLRVFKPQGRPVLTNDEMDSLRASLNASMLSVSNYHGKIRVEAFVAGLEAMVKAWDHTWHKDNNNNDATAEDFSGHVREANQYDSEDESPVVPSLDTEGEHAVNEEDAAAALPRPLPTGKEKEEEALIESVNNFDEGDGGFSYDHFQIY